MTESVRKTKLPGVRVSANSVRRSGRQIGEETLQEGCQTYSLLRSRPKSYVHLEKNSLELAAKPA